MLREVFILRVQKADGKVIDVKLGDYPTKEIIHSALINFQGMTAWVDRRYELGRVD